MPGNEQHSASAVPTAGTSTSLLWRAGQGDDESVRQVFFLYQPLIHRWCRIKGLNESDTEDVSQEVLIAVFSGIAGFQRERTGSFRAWMRKITQHKIADRFRKQHEVAVGGTDFQNRVEEMTAESEKECGEDTERQIVLRQAAKMLQLEFSFTSWQAFYRSEIDEHDPASICQELQLTPGALRVARCRVRKRLREVMEGLLT
jgi:RNA polymerase sigma-70 factor (ECF subfamily)